MDFHVPPARGPIAGCFEVPPSKSLHQRALVLAALGEMPVDIAWAGAASPGEDVRALAAALDALGPWRDGALGGAERAARRLDLGLGATGFRFALALATLRAPGARTLVTGRPGLRGRPHAPLARALRSLGGHVRRRRSGAYRVLGGGIGGRRRIDVPASDSSQYASALALIAPRLGGLCIHLTGEVVSQPYLDLTLSLLARFGIDVERDGASIRVGAGAPAATRVHLEADASAAAAWWVAAVLTGGSAVVRGIRPDSAQADARVLAILGDLAGVCVAKGPAGIRVAGRATRGGGTIDLRDAPDLLPLVAVLAARVPGVTRLEGIAHTRLKESDRPATVARGLRHLGAEVGDDGRDRLEIVGGRPLTGAVIDVAGDHRLAFAFGVLGLVVPGVVLRGAEAVGKSHPGFLAQLAALGSGTREKKARP